MSAGSSVKALIDLLTVPIAGEILLFKASLPKSDVVVEVIGRVRQDITTGLDLYLVEALSLLLLLLAGRPWTLG